MYALLKPLLFLLPPEKAHGLTMWILHFIWRMGPAGKVVREVFKPKKAASVCVMGLHFPNAIGLAAGFDKDGKHILPLAMLGFGSIEVGTVTPKPQAGNPKPRLFRLTKDRALINRMGFNNEGLDALEARLKKIRMKHPDLKVVIGGNIGKNKDTPNAEAASDYLLCFKKLFPWVDYFVVNVSSPNTPNLRALQDKKPLMEILEHLQTYNLIQLKPKPILLKIAPDLTDEQLEDIADIAKSTGLSGIIATNTTLDRFGLSATTQSLQRIGEGGLSGGPLGRRSTEVIQFLRQRLGPDVVLIGVGGIATPEDAQAKIEAGANLLQVYTGLVYEGPGLVRRLANHISGI